MKEELAASLGKDFFARFPDEKHDDMSVTPSYLVSDVQAEKLKMEISAVKDEEEYASLLVDGAAFKQQYLADAQRMFSRVQHHMHKRTKKGMVPLQACKRKGTKKKNCLTCKTDFPKNKLCLSLIHI